MVRLFAYDTLDTLAVPVDVEWLHHYYLESHASAYNTHSWLVHAQPLRLVLVGHIYSNQWLSGSCQCPVVHDTAERIVFSISTASTFSSAR